MSDILAKQAQHWLKRNPSNPGVVDKLCKELAKFSAITRLRIASRPTEERGYRNGQSTILSVTDAFFLLRHALPPSRAISLIMDRPRPYRKLRTGFPKWSMPPADHCSLAAMVCWCHVRPGPRHFPRIYDTVAILQLGFPGDLGLDLRHQLSELFLRRAGAMYWRFQTFARNASPTPFAAYLRGDLFTGYLEDESGIAAQSLVHS